MERSWRVRVRWWDMVMLGWGVLVVWSMLAFFWVVRGVVIGLVVVGKDSFQRLISLVFPAVASNSTTVLLLLLLLVLVLVFVLEDMGIGLVLLPTRPFDVILVVLVVPSTSTLSVDGV